MKLTGLLKHLSKAKAQRPSVLKMLEEVHKTAQTDPKDFSPRFSFSSITTECAAGKCHCAKPRLVGDGTYGNLDDRFWSGLQTYITYHCQHSKGAASLKAVRQVAVFAYAAFIYFYTKLWLFFLVLSCSELLSGSFTAVSFMPMFLTGVVPFLLVGDQYHIY